MAERKESDAINVKRKYKKQSQVREVWNRLKKNKSALAGMVIMLLIIGSAIFADVLFDYDDVVIKQNISNRNQWPSAAHPFGTDDKGRDILARVVHGARTSLVIAFSTAAFAFVVGGILGAIAGFYGGLVDNFLMRLMDVFLAIPGTLFAITIVAALGASTFNLIIALAISSVPRFARIVRSSVMTVRDVEFIEAARAIGASDFRIITQHVIPNSLTPVLVHTTLNIATIILTIAGLSFLGLGIQSPTPEWGGMLSESRPYLRDFSYMSMFPGLAIVITILSLNLLGDGLRDALDPRLK
ncbi:MAG: peptide ABC transporter permease [Treponema sp.]|nr:MAG: peptide ABC transporter permease [Treponema sp.]